MTEEKPLTAILTPKVDTENLSDFKTGIAEAFSEAMADADVTSELGFTLTVDETMMKHLDETVASLGQTFANFNTPLSELNKTLSSLQSTVPQATSAINGISSAGTSSESIDKMIEEGKKNETLWDKIYETNSESTELLKSGNDSSYTFLGGILNSTTTTAEILQSETGKVMTMLDGIQTTLTSASETISSNMGSTSQTNKEFSKEYSDIMKEETKKRENLWGSISNKLDSLGKLGATAGGIFSGGSQVSKSLGKANEYANSGEYYKASLSRLDAIKTIGDTGFNTVIGIGKSFMEIFEKLWKMIVDSSPLLKSVLGLFDTALSLIFMPIGNKIAEIMIPDIIDIMERIGDIWDTMDDLYEQGGLGAMIEYAVITGIEILFDKIHSFINILQDSNTDWMVAIGDLLEAVVTLAESALIPTLIVIMNATTFVLNHLKEFTVALVGFYTGFKASVAYAHSQILRNMKSINSSIVSGFKSTQATIAANTKGLIATVKTENSKNRLLTKLATKLGLIGKATQTASTGAQIATIEGPAAPGAVLAGILGAVASMAITGLAMEALGLKSGGYVPATEGGEVHILAEGGEGEFVVPESKAQKFAEDYGKQTGTTGGNTYNIYINGYTDSELKQYIVDVVNDRSSLSRIRAGF